MLKGMRKDGLLAEINGVQSFQFVEPPKHSGNFEVEGLMNDFEKQVYTVMTRIMKQIDENLEALSHAETSASRKGTLNFEIRVLNAKLTYAKDLMYFSINDRLDLWDKNTGISQGYKIVIPEEEAVHVIEIPIELPPELSEKIKAALEKAAAEKGKCEGCKTCFTSTGSSTVH